MQNTLLIKQMDDDPNREGEQREHVNSLFVMNSPQIRGFILSLVPNMAPYPQYQFARCTRFCLDGRHQHRHRLGQWNARQLRSCRFHQ